MTVTELQGILPTAKHIQSGIMEFADTAARFKQSPTIIWDTTRYVAALQFGAIVFVVLNTMTRRMVTGYEEEIHRWSQSVLSNLTLYVAEQKRLSCVAVNCLLYQHKIPDVC